MKVFISYSRKDGEFAEELLSGLRLVGFEPYFDKRDIAPGEDWETRLDRLIAAADTIVFVISPDAVSSNRCAWEVRRAIERKKRILPVVWRRVDEALVPPELKQLNYLFFDKPLMSVPALVALGTALRTDLDWIREHTRIGEAAARWNDRGRNTALLYRGEELAGAKAWLAGQPRFAPEPTLLQHEFIKAGEDEEAVRTSADRQRLEQMVAAQDEREKALLREKEAQSARELAVAERELAVRQERAALDRIRRAQRAIGALLGAIIFTGTASVIGIAFKESIAEFIFQQTTARAFAAREFRPYVLAADKEAGLERGATFRECAATCPEMVVLPAGSFQMGSQQSEPGRHANEGALRTVNIARSFAIGKFEVTWDEWEACVAMHGCDGRPTGAASFGKGHKPVINISWEQSQAYVEWLSRMTGKKYRLLTEAEWEYAARAGTQSLYSFGDDAADLCRNANTADLSYLRNGFTGDIVQCDDGNAGTAVVGSYAPNAFGVYDMHGNVWEWVQDCYHDLSLVIVPKDGSAAPETPDCFRVRRGGSWDNAPNDVRLAERGRTAPFSRYVSCGFRVARELAANRP